MVLPVDTIEAGTNVLLDVRKRKLLVSKAMGNSVVLLNEFEIHTENDSLDFFEYLQKYESRFSSTKII